ncbi:MAG: SagB/ThcOx family dehydrogenase [Rhodospirillales bacterium]|jgi:SagB-type dehydrogenase family enzyme|nr:SagB/ThcOx family dehydrogenase [Rhodospirillales bacterium]
MNRFGRSVVVAVIVASWFGPMAMTFAAPDSISLPPPRPASAVSVEEALASRRSVRHFADAPLTLADAAQLLWAAQGITHAEGLRTAPSAGALYPLEVYLVAGTVVTVPAGVYRYLPAPHRLERTVSGDPRRALAAAAFHQSWIAEAPAIVVIAAVVRRTRLKYGERGERYVPIEAGHAAQNVGLQAVALGLGTTIVGAFSDAEVKRVLGLTEEEPLLLVPVGKPG